MRNPLKFEKINLQQQNAYQQYLAQCSQVASDYSFVNIWSWSMTHGLEWAWSNALVWIRQTIPQTIHWAPVGNWQQISWPTVLKTHFGGSLKLIRIPEALENLWFQDIQLNTTAVEQREHWDYLYDVNALAALKGNRYHKKKNLVRQFQKKYPDFEYRSFGPETAAEALSLQNDWCTWRDCEASQSLSAENKAIERVFQDWDFLPGLMAGGLWVADRMVAYTVAERLTDRQLLIHFEKADQEYKGAYQAINQLFLADHQTRFDVVNREQDLGDPGLRKAKESYHPIDYTRKFKVTLDIS